MRLKSIAVFFAVSAITLGACGNSETKGAAGESTGVNTEASGDISLQKDTSSGEDGNLKDLADEDISEIEVMFWTLNTLPADVEMVEDAINEITREKINTEVHLNIMEMGNYVQQLNLMISGGEKLDLLATQPGGSAHFNSMESQNQLMDITDLLNEYAPELLSVVPKEWLAGTTVNGRIYGVTPYGDKATPLGFGCRKDILEQTGIDPSTIKTASDLENLFEKVLEVDPQMTPVATGAKKILTAPYLINSKGEFVKYDGLGDGDNCLIGVMDSDGTKIQNNYLRQEYIDTSKRFVDWYEKGYVYKDGANYSETQEALIAGGTAFGLFKCFQTGAEETLSSTCGHEMVIIKLDEEPVIDTLMLRKFTWTVPSTATEPEAAVKFMNLLYTDPEVLNLITWGIEGIHYETQEDGSIDFVDGQDGASCGYYLGDETAIIGNGFLAKVRSGQDLDLRDEAEKINLNASVSAFNGFSFNSDGYENEVAGITNTIEEYRPSFACGLYTEDYYNEFLKKLKDSGVERYIEYIQQQFDSWLAESTGK